MSEINDLTFEGQTIIDVDLEKEMRKSYICLLYTSPSPRDA